MNLITILLFIIGISTFLPSFRLYVIMMKISGQLKLEIYVSFYTNVEELPKF